MRAHFFRKAGTIADLKELITNSHGSEYTIEETLELEPEEYKVFSNNLLYDFDFISRAKEKMFMDNNHVRHCILIKAKGERDGILVESQGYDYARYSAYFPGEDN